MASLFGKLPSQLDFVRVRHDAPVAVAFDGWLEQAVQELARANLAWPATPVHFVFAPAAQPSALLGVVRASRDRAGRKFPVAVYAVLARNALVAALPGLGRLSFLAQAEALSAELDGVAKDELPARLAALPAPDGAALRTATEGALEALEARPAAALADSLAARVGAVESALAFVAAALRAPAGAASPVLDCALEDAGDLDAWLALVHGNLAPSAVPSLFWHGPSGRLLVSAGDPPAQLASWLAAVGRRHPRLVAPPGSADAATGPVETTVRELVARFTLSGRN